MQCGRKFNEHVGASRQQSTKAEHVIVNNSNVQARCSLRFPHFEGGNTQSAHNEHESNSQQQAGEGAGDEGALEWKEEIQSGGVELSE